MPKRQYTMTVLSNPIAGRERECEDWYNRVHLPEMVTLPGFVRARRLRLAHPMQAASPWQFLAIYDIETDDLDATLAVLFEAAETGRIEVSDALDRQNAYAVVYEASGEAVQAFSAAPLDGR